jgi:hypothetical protein
MSMTRIIRGLALSLLVGLSVAGLTLAQTPGGPRVLEPEEALEEPLEAEEELRAKGAPEGEEGLLARPCIAGSQVKNGTTDSRRNPQMRTRHTFPPVGPMPFV